MGEDRELGSPTVLLDATVLINLAITDRLDLLEGLSGYRFRTPQEALAEVLRKHQRSRIQRALQAGSLERVSLESHEESHRFQEFARNLGRGEAACLALASIRGWWLASDDHRALKRTRQELPERRILNTPRLFLLAIRAGLLTVEEADETKRILAENRFRMGFDSFAELL